MNLYVTLLQIYITADIYWPSKREAAGAGLHITTFKAWAPQIIQMTDQFLSF